MNFLNPALLWALPLASAPVILHLLFLRRARPLPFSDLELLRRVYLKTLPSSRLRQWLLLAARCLLLLLLVAAFARPVFRSGAFQAFAAGPAEQEGLRLVLLLDTSWSMGYRSAGEPRLEAAKRAGRALLASLKPEDRVAVGVFSDRAPALAWAATLEEAAKALDAPLSLKPTDANAAVEAAYALLAEQPAARQGIILLSDNAAHGFRQAPALKPGVELLSLGWTDTPENAAASGVTAAGEKPVRLVAEVAAEPPAERPLHLWIEGRHSGEKSVKAPGSTTLELHRSEPGRFWAWTELLEDRLPSDDRWYFTHQVRAKPKVLVLHASGGFFDAGRGGRFLRRMFSDPDGALLPFEVDFLDLRRLRPGELEPYRAVLLAASGTVPEDAARALTAFVQDGGGLMTILEPELESGGLGSLSKVLGGDAGAALVLPERRMAVAQAPDAADWRFAWQDFDLERVEVHRAYDLRLNPGARVWLQTRAGKPLMVERRYGEGRTLLWASNLDPAWTNLPLKPVFAAWLQAALGDLAQARERAFPAQVKVGQVWELPWDPTQSGGDAMWVEGPDRKRTQVFPQGERLRFAGTDKPGIYWFERGAKREPFAVNLDRSTGESDLRPLSPSPFFPLSVEDPAGSLRTRFYGSEVRWAFLYGVLALLALETLLAKRRRDA